jgi:hypothetical protein
MNLSDKITNTNRGKQKIVYDGYSYYYRGVKTDIHTWRCRAVRCTGKIYTNNDNILLNSTTHNHSKNESVELVLVFNAMKKRSLVTSETSRDIVLNALQEVNCDISVTHTVKYFRDQITKFRKEHMFSLKENCDIPEQFFRTLGSKIDFLLHDSGINENERIVIFATEQNLIHLQYNTIWVCDSTFSVVPQNYEQFFTIQGLVRGKYVPLLFCSMKKKNIRSYDAIFRIMLEKKTPAFTIASCTRL